MEHFKTSINYEKVAVSREFRRFTQTAEQKEKAKKMWTHFIGGWCALLALAIAGTIWTDSALVNGAMMALITSVALVLAAAVFLWILFIQKWKKRLNDNRNLMRRLDVSFLDDVVIVHCPITAQTNRYGYMYFDDLTETKSLYVLSNRMGKVVIVSKKQLVKARQDQRFIEFIKKKCEYIKWEE